VEKEEFKKLKNTLFFETIDWGLLEAGYLDPPFVPSKYDVNAAPLKDIGDFDRNKYKHVKLDETFKKTVQVFEFVSVRALQDEMVKVLEKADESVNFEKFAAKLQKVDPKKTEGDGGCCTLS